MLDDCNICPFEKGEMVRIESNNLDWAGLGEVIHHSCSDSNPEFHVIKVQVLNGRRNHSKTEQFYRHGLRKLT